MLVPDKAEEREFIKVVGGTSLGCLVFAVLIGLIVRVHNEGSAQANTQEVQEVPDKEQPKRPNVNSGEFKRKLRNTVYGYLKKTANPKWDSLVLKDYGVNSDNTVDHVGFKIIYKRHAYELYSPVTYRDMQNVVNAARKFLQNAQALEANEFLSGGTRIYCSGHGKRIWDDKLPPLVIDDMPLGMEVGIGFQE